MSQFEDQEISTYIRQLYEEDQEVRIHAITQLGNVGDELCLKELREQLKYINKEHQALIIAVGKLKKKLGVK